MKIYIAIISCHENNNPFKVYYPNEQKELRDKIRKTWITKIPSNIEYNFFVGKSKSSLPETDTINLPVNDSYEFLVDKMYRIFEYINKHKSFDYVFKCDDSTYFFPERIEQLITDLKSPNFIANKFDLDSHVHGGAGYILSKECVKVLTSLDRQELISTLGEISEDVWVTKVLSSKKIIYTKSKRLTSNRRSIIEDLNSSPVSIEIDNLNQNVCDQIEKIYNSSY